MIKSVYAPTAHKLPHCRRHLADKLPIILAADGLSPPLQKAQIMPQLQALSTPYE
jgi:hypothetical protein